MAELRLTLDADRCQQESFNSVYTLHLEFQCWLQEMDRHSRVPSDTDWSRDSSEYIFSSINIESLYIE